MYASIMPGVVDTPEHRDKLQTIISISGGQARVVQYLESVQHSLQPNDLQIGVILLHISVLTTLIIAFRCPNKNISCQTVEFDNIKMFYHLTPPHRPPTRNPWNFFISPGRARLRTSALIGPPKALKSWSGVRVVLKFSLSDNIISFLLWTIAYTLLEYSSQLFIRLRNSYSSVMRDRIFPQFFHRKTEVRGKSLRLSFHLLIQYTAFYYLGIYTLYD